jgi:hypothetical protein
MPFVKGQPKPKNSGRQKGIPNKSSSELQDSLMSYGCNFNKALAEAIIRNDAEMVRALQGLVGYFLPKYAPKEAPPSPSDISTSSPLNASSDDLISLVKDP